MRIRGMAYRPPPPHRQDGAARHSSRSGGKTRKNERGAPRRTRHVLCPRCWTLGCLAPVQQAVERSWFRSAASSRKGVVGKPRRPLIRDPCSSNFVATSTTHHSHHNSAIRRDLSLRTATRSPRCRGIPPPVRSCVRFACGARRATGTRFHAIEWGRSTHLTTLRTRDRRTRRVRSRAAMQRSHARMRTSLRNAGAAATPPAPP